MTRHLTGIDGDHRETLEAAELQECSCGSSWWTVRGTPESNGMGGLCLDRDDRIVGRAGALVCADCGRDRDHVPALKAVE
jgi:hypothetical protein